MVTSRPERTRVVVIGAGPAGLAAALELQRVFPGRDGVLVIERGAVGQAWRQRYEELRLNTTRATSRLPGVPIPRQAGRWVARRDYVDYLQGAAGRLSNLVRTGTSARRVDPTPDGRWRVLTDGGELMTDHVVVATGHDAVPALPDWAGPDTYRGTALHASDVRRLADYAGRRVVVVGGGDTGIDMAGQLTACGAHVTLCVRTPPTVLPRQWLGIPLQPVAVATRRLPLRARDALALSTSRLALGDLTRAGLPRPSVGPYTRFATSRVTVAVDSGFVAALVRGQVRLAPAATGWTPTGVAVVGGGQLDADVVILATGYRCGLEPLLGHLDVLDADGRPGQVSPVAHGERRGLFFAGFRPAVEGTLRTVPTVPTLLP